MTLGLLLVDANVTADYEELHDYEASYYDAVNEVFYPTVLGNCTVMTFISGCRYWAKQGNTSAWIANTANTRTKVAQITIITYLFGLLP